MGLSGAYENEFVDFLHARNVPVRALQLVRVGIRSKWSSFSEVFCEFVKDRPSIIIDQLCNELREGPRFSPAEPPEFKILRPCKKEEPEDDNYPYLDYVNGEEPENEINVNPDDVDPSIPLFTTDLIKVSSVDEDEEELPPLFEGQASLLCTPCSVKLTRMSDNEIAIMQGRRCRKSSFKMETSQLTWRVVSPPAPSDKSHPLRLRLRRTHKGDEQNGDDDAGVAKQGLRQGGDEAATGKPDMKLMETGESSRKNKMRKLDCDDAASK